MALKHVKYIEIDDQKGILYSAGKQSLLVPITFVKTIDFIFSQLVGKKGADILIYKIGEALGKGYVQTLKKILEKEKIEIHLETEITMTCNAIFMEAGWGQVSIQKIDLREQILEAKLRYSPSGEFLKKSEYNLERGVLAGIYQEIAKKEVYCRLLKEDKKKHEIILRISKKIPKDIKEQEKLVLVSRQELEKKIEERTKELLVAKEVAEKEKDKTLTIIQNFTDGLIVLDAYRTIAMINPEAEKMIGLPKETIERKKLNDLKENPFFQKLINIILKNGSIKQVFREGLNLKENMVIEVTTIPLNREGSALGYLIILHDISREKLTEKMKTEFVSLAAHQLRTPLTKTKWALKSFLGGELGEINKQQEEFIKKSYSANEKIIALVNDLLGVTAIEEGRYLHNPILANIEDLIKSVIESLQGEIKRKRLIFEFEKPKEKLPQIWIDKEKMEIVIQNLVENAVRYTEIGGRVTIALKSSGKEIEFSVRDTGVGIPREQQNRIFIKFFRAPNVIKMETEGTGLGLFIAKNIIEAHKGRVWFESEEGKGSIFYFTLPIKSDKI